MAARLIALYQAMTDLADDRTAEADDDATETDDPVARNALTADGAEAERPDKYKQLILGLQRKLHQLGEYTGSIEGRYGPITRAAMCRAKELLGLDRDDEITEEALRQLDCARLDDTGALHIDDPDDAKEPDGGLAPTADSDGKEPAAEVDTGGDGNDKGKDGADNDVSSDSGAKQTDKEQEKPDDETLTDKPQASGAKKKK